jgi:DNA-binding MarR family transcriptional regulator
VTVVPDPGWEDRLALPEEVGLVRRVARLALLVDQAMDAIAARHGLSRADYLVLAVVRRSPGGRTTAAALCEVLGRASGGMTLALDRLQAAGLVTRAPDPGDRRKVLVGLAPPAEVACAAVSADLRAWEAALPLDAAARRAATDLLADLVHAAEAAPAR